MPDEKNPVDQVLDLFVFAPLGLAITARTQLPEMMAKGRAQVEGQISMARFIGQFAVQQGKVEAEKRLKAFTSPAPPPAPEKPVAEPPPAEADPRPEPEPPATVALPLTLRAEPAPTAEPPPDGAGGAAPLAGDLAIPGYDALSASQVVQRLAGLSASELEQVRRYEAATRSRKTVLTKISQLQ